MRFPLSARLARRLEQRIGTLAAEVPITDQNAYRIAKTHGMLPLARGLDAYYAMALTGELMEFSWAAFDQPFPMFDQGRAYGVIDFASRKFPELRALLPRRLKDDPFCAECSGTGAHPLREATRDIRVICECGGLGFLPRCRPDGEHAPARYTGSVFPDITPAKITTGHIYQIDAEQDITTEDELRRLLDVMFEHPEHPFIYYARKDGPSNIHIADALANKIITHGEVEFFYYRDAPGSRNFMHVQNYDLDDSRAEILFALDKTYVEHLRVVASGPMYSKTVLTLTARAHRAIVAEQARDDNPLDVKVGVGAIKLDLRKCLTILQRWWNEWRSRR